jgi:hypothetical protein
MIGVRCRDPILRIDEISAIADRDLGADLLNS